MQIRALEETFNPINIEFFEDFFKCGKTRMFKDHKGILKHLYTRSTRDLGNASGVSYGKFCSDFFIIFRSCVFRGQLQLGRHIATPPQGKSG